MLRRLLYLQPGELNRLWPFFGLYFLLFGALTVADVKADLAAHGVTVR